MWNSKNVETSRQPSQHRNQITTLTHWQDPAKSVLRPCKPHTVWLSLLGSMDVCCLLYFFHSIITEPVPRALVPWQSWAIPNNCTVFHHHFPLCCSHITRVAGPSLLECLWSQDFWFRTPVNCPPWVLTQETILSMSLGQKAEEPVKKQTIKGYTSPIGQRKIHGHDPQVVVIYIIVINPPWYYYQTARKKKSEWAQNSKFKGKEVSVVTI